MWQRLQRNAGYSLASLALVAVLGFGAMFFNARALGVNGLGVYAGVLAISFLLENLAGMQCWQAIIALAKGREGRIFGAALALNFTLTLPSALIGMALLFLLDMNVGLAGYFHMATLVVRVPDPILGILRLRDQFGFIAAARSMIAVITLVIAASLYFFDAALSAYIVTAALAQVGYTAILFARSRDIVSPAKPSVNEVREIFKFALPSGLSGAIGGMRQRGVVVLLGLVSGVGAVGIYSVADRIAAVMQMGYRALFEATFREMADARRQAAFIAAIGAGGIVLSLAAIGLTAWLGELVITVAAGPDFASAADTLTVLVAAVCATIVTMGLRAWIIISLGPRIMLFCNVFALSALLAAPWLMRLYGAMGAALTQLAFEGLWVIAVTVVAIRNRGRFSKQS